MLQMTERQRMFEITKLNIEKLAIERTIDYTLPENMPYVLARLCVIKRTLEIYYSDEVLEIG